MQPCCTQQHVNIGNATTREFLVWELAILPSGFSDDGGVDGVSRRLNTVRQIAMLTGVQTMFYLTSSLRTCVPPRSPATTTR
jgi:hypothetical protein